MKNIGLPDLTHNPINPRSKLDLTHPLAMSRTCHSVLVVGNKGEEKVMR